MSRDRPQKREIRRGERTRTKYAAERGGVDVSSELSRQMDYADVSTGPMKTLDFRSKTSA